MTDTIKVLHVTESYGGGVTSAIKEYAAHSSFCEHHLAAVLREADRTGEEQSDLFASLNYLKRGLSGLFQLVSLVKSTRPDVIHVHSSIAGLVCRLLPQVSSQRLVYTPHGYSFLRADGDVLNGVYFLVEKILARRTAVIAGCGRAEANMSIRLIGADRTCELVNVCGELGDVLPIHVDTSLPVVCMVGRVSDQKGFRFFNEVAGRLRGQVYFKWIGGGDESKCDELISQGVDVTGWLTRRQALAHLKGVDLYFHTAAWEGFPISVLEAAAFELPIVLRNIRPFKDESLPVVDGVEEAVDFIAGWCNRQSKVVELSYYTSRCVREYHSRANLETSLKELYEGIVNKRA